MMTKKQKVLQSLGISLMSNGFWALVWPVSYACFAFNVTIGFIGVYWWLNKTTREW